MDIFCKIIKGDIPSRCLFEDDKLLVIMDVNPRSNGHSLIIPKTHYQDLYDIDDDTLKHIMKVARNISLLLKEKLNYDGITLEENNGAVQEVKHFHLHLIPYYENKVINDVDEVYKRIMDK